MHEHTFIDAIVRDIEDKANVEKIILEVGELAGIEGSHLAEHIRERFDWDVEAVQKEGLVKCECGYEGRPKILEKLHDLVIFECPKCEGVAEALEGKDIKIVKIIYK